MCMKYEDEYLGCFDWMMFDPPDYDTHSIKLLLEDWYGVKIVDEAKFRERLYSLFEKAHEEGVIRPTTEAEDSEGIRLAIEQERAFVIDGMTVFHGLARYDKKS